MKAEKLMSLIKKEIEDARIKARDLTGTEDHYEVIVGSDMFKSLSLVQQHQLVYRALGDAFPNDLHALSIKTCALSEWEEKLSQS